MANKKIINAESTTIDGIVFKSRLEGKMYELLKSSGLDFKYESERIVLVERFKPDTPWYNGTEACITQFGNITYKPDFVIYKDGVSSAYIEIKGFPNDSWPLRRKLLLKYLYDTKSNALFFEIHNIKEMQQCILKLKELWVI